MQIDAHYKNWLRAIKHKIKSAQLKAAVTVNTQLLELYWDLGKDIAQKQKEANWGDAVLEQLSVDLKLAFPAIKGFSRRNLYAIKQWYSFYGNGAEFVPQLVAQIPWGHNRLIISKIKNTEEALFYCKATLHNGWSREQLEIAIKNDYFETKGKAITNFAQSLPAQQSQLAIETLKNPYSLDFLGLEDDALEKELEDAMMQHLTQFLIELGKGFAFVGRQYSIAVSQNEYFIDLLFYHLQLRCYIAIELKTGKFKPEYAGKLNFYLSAIDSQIKHTDDQPSIGLILCKHKDKIEAEYALRDIQKPIGISEYTLTQALPKQLKNQLPTVEEIEAQLQKTEKNRFS
ncbi:MAG TPA: PDDEXK nuclease domain-containing protein [Gelidibacter sp.]|uniref:PDDEXK nuclease domain-containing protein n=1 Tax=Gelidibacter sp. TaxID=2018083 RepID=UPI002C5E48D5|nr:PDDEXK nuclease domain-containing protein [Gelidibacter sp.]HXJ99720.1 PDDEXK nuclease domain-containing protein [Gelidibacter sp.]